jgi:hypothetical protein
MSTATAICVIRKKGTFGSKIVYKPTKNLPFPADLLCEFSISLLIKRIARIAVVGIKRKSLWAFCILHM